MPRRARPLEDNVVYHVLNRAVRRAVLFESDDDYVAFEETLSQGLQRVPVRLLAYSAMPNHWHLLVWPERGRDLSSFMHWFSGTHAQRWHASHRTTGSGYVYQNRYKSFRLDDEASLLRAWRYIERNALKAGLVGRAEEWRWCSLWRRRNRCDKGMLSAPPFPLPVNWVALVNDTAAEAGTGIG